MTKYAANDKIPSITLQTINHATISIPDAQQYTHLQFRRFVGCPVCQLHMHELQKRHEEIKRANIREVIVFYSTEDKMNELLEDLPFDFIADPIRKYYARFGVDKKIRAVLDPRGWPTMMRAIAARGSRIFSSIPGSNETILGLPADFLIDKDGNIIAAKYGVHANDQWSVDDLLGYLK